MGTMYDTYPFSRGTIKKGDTRVCTKIPFKESRIITDFYNLIWEEGIFIDHPYLDKKERNGRFNRFNN